MNLQSQISEELWDAVRSSYTAGHYTHAIRDAMALVTEVLRDKSGQDGDGRELVGRALGYGKGSMPKIQVNKLETQTEHDIQKGLREVISGMYRLVRNPRTHERVEDDKQTADAIICFINYLLKYLGESKSAFTVGEFVEKVADPHFVANQEYIEALVESVPVRKRADTMIALFSEADWESADSSELILKALLRGASKVEVDHLLNAVSRYLERVMDGAEVSLVRKLLPAELWPRISTTSRLRAEEILIKSLNGAWYDPADDRAGNTPATWLSGITSYITLRSSLRSAILGLLNAEHHEHANFVAKYFFEELPDIFREYEELPDVFRETVPIKLCVNAIAKSIKSGNGFVERRLHECVHDYPETWFGPLGKALKPPEDATTRHFYLPDGTPLLVVSGAEEDDIPF